MLMAADMRVALDPGLLGERVGLDLDSWQAELIAEEIETRPEVGRVFVIGYGRPRR